MTPTQDFILHCYSVALASWHTTTTTIVSLIQHILPGLPPLPGKPSLKFFQHIVDGLHVDGRC